MAGLMDRIRGMFGSRSRSGVSDGDTGARPLDTLKEKAGDVKEKVDELVDKVGEKMPDKVKGAYEKVSEKVEDLLPGRKDDDADGADANLADDVTGAGADEAAVDAAEGNPYANPEGTPPAN